MKKKQEKKAVKKTKKSTGTGRKTSTRQQKVDIVLRVRQESPAPAKAVPQEVLDPIKEENKMVVPKTWLSKKQLLVMTQRTDPKYIRQRKGKGGQVFDYVDGSYIEKVLNYTFGWLWDFEILSEQSFAVESGHGQVVVRGKLTVKDMDGNVLVKTQYGRADIKYFKDRRTTPVDLGNDFKAAATDALKKCASLLGIASDIYGKQELKESGLDLLPPGNNAPQKQVPAEKPTTVPTKGAPVIYCFGCGNELSKPEFEFSKRFWGKPYCRQCQKLYPKKK